MTDDNEPIPRGFLRTIAGIDERVELPSARLIQLLDAEEQRDNLQKVLNGYIDDLSHIAFAVASDKTDAVNHDDILGFVQAVVAERDQLRSALERHEPSDPLLDRLMDAEGSLREELDLLRGRYRVAWELNVRLRAVAEAANELLNEDRTSWSPEHARLGEALAALDDPHPTEVERLLAVVEAARRTLDRTDNEQWSIDHNALVDLGAALDALDATGEVTDG